MPWVRWCAIWACREDRFLPRFRSHLPVLPQDTRSLSYLCGSGGTVTEGNARGVTEGNAMGTMARDLGLPRRPVPAALPVAPSSAPTRIPQPSLSLWEQWKPRWRAVGPGREDRALPRFRSHLPVLPQDTRSLSYLCGSGGTVTEGNARGVTEGNAMGTMARDVGLPRRPVTAALPVAPSSAPTRIPQPSLSLWERCKPRWRAVGPGREDRALPRFRSHLPVLPQDSRSLSYLCGSGGSRDGARWGLAAKTGPCRVAGRTFQCSHKNPAAFPIFVGAVEP